MSYPYNENTEAAMKQFYDSLCERDKRRYAALESMKLTQGGINYISGLLGCDPKTIRSGREELKGSKLDSERIRKPGGGRKKKHPNLNTVD